MGTDLVRRSNLQRAESFDGPLRRLISLVVIGFVLAGCAVQLEPSYDARIVKEIETLTLETQTFFASVPEGIPAAGYPKREKTYITLAGRAAAIKVYAEARPAPSGKVVDFFQNLIAIPAPPGIAGSVGGSRTTGSPISDRYENATAGFMDDYLRNLKKLAKKDRSVAASAGNLSQFNAAQAGFQSALKNYQTAYADWVAGRGVKPADLGAAPVPPAGHVSKNFVERRQTVINDVLHDALVYERDILNRNR